MNRSKILLAPMALALLAVGCNDYQVSSGAHRATEAATWDTSWYEEQQRNERIAEDLRRSAERLHRQRRDTWRDHNRRHHGGNPGWGRDHDRKENDRRDPERDWKNGDRNDHRDRGPGREIGRDDSRDHNSDNKRERERGDRSDRQGFQASLSELGLNALVASTSRAATAQTKPPAMTREYHTLCQKIGKAYGISHNAAIQLMEALNRAAVEDFQGLKALGLSAKGLEAAYKNNGRFSAGELDTLSRKLGISRQKADQVIQRMLQLRK